jgi:ribosome-binding factor A
MSKRTEQVAELLRSNINQIIVKDFEAPKGTLISVSEVTVSPDLKNATCLVSVIPNNKIGSALEAIKKFAGHAQRELSKRMAIRATPRIKFALDERDLKYKAIDDALSE